MKIIDEKTKEFLFGLKEQVSGNWWEHKINENYI